MASRKYNEFLDAGSSDDNLSGSHDSDDAQERKGKGLTSLHSLSKRQKRGHQSSDKGSDNVHIPEPTEGGITHATKTPEAPSTSTVMNNNTPNHISPPPPELTATKSAKPKIKSTTSARTHKPGVVYLSRIPPFMRPSTVRHLLSSFGPITKIFLTPEPPAQHTSRVRSGGNKKRSFIDGWVEFASHISAKTCVAAINGQTMGGRGWYRDDVWNAKYLRGFGWEDLMAGVRAEEREREEKVRLGVRREKKEREEFLKGVERAKVEEGKKRKREGRKRKEAEGGDDGVEAKKEGFERRFRQNEVKSKRKIEGQPEEVSRVLSQIF
ncbi:MAG: hypothetical protein L6R40_004206 [Gallowayella cf. fulva]|nr:MAG: hypothetical protein L6R40_004206 [Xanthomendoza cf. fulva]